MIETYEFIDKNNLGLKERLLGATIELFNKLSAEETNNFRAKINELVAAINTTGIPLFPKFALKFKAEGNLDPNVLQVGDIVHGFYDALTIWDNAAYNGGDPNNKASYTKIETSFEPILFTATGALNLFTLPAGMKAQHLFLDRGLKYKGSEWDQSGDEVEYLGPLLAAGRKIYIIP